MNKAFILFMLKVSVALLIITSLEWGYGVYLRQQLLDSLAATKSQSHQPDSLPTVQKLKQLDAYGAIESQPLFIEGRKPLVGQDNADTSNVANLNLPDWKLTGIYSTEKGMTALFRRVKKQAVKGNYLKLKQNDKLVGWVLTKIQQDRVILVRGEQRKQMMLRVPGKKQRQQKKRGNTSFVKKKNAKTKNN